MGRANELRRKLQLVYAATGPAPWYFHKFPPCSCPDGGTLAWAQVSSCDGRQSATVLHAPTHQSTPFLAVRIYTRVYSLGPGLLGMWWPEDRRIRFAAIDISRLKEFPIEDFWGDEDKRPRGFLEVGEPVSEFEVSATLPEGQHRVNVPDVFRAVPEVFAPIPANRLDAIASICCFNMTESELRVIDQPWTRDFDAGYQWITRLIRDPKTGLICGDGIRIRAFELDETDTRIKSWLE